MERHVICLFIASMCNMNTGKANCNTLTDVHNWWCPGLCTWQVWILNMARQRKLQVNNRIIFRSHVITVLIELNFTINPCGILSMCPNLTISSTFKRLRWRILVWKNKVTCSFSLFIIIDNSLLSDACWLRWYGG
jgi:hypothetical protein